jgi:hypothetical protein
MSDPFAQLAAPAQPANTETGPYQHISATCASTPNATNCAGTVPGNSNNGCQDTASGCDEYRGGYYSGGISVKNATAIFDPGVYYLNNGFSAAANSCLRPSTQTGDGTGGTMFYLADAGALSVGANSGSCPAPISTSSGTGPLQYGVKCTATSDVPSNLPATLTGNVLLGPCSGTYGDPLGTDDPIGEQHGMLFFRNRSSSSGVNDSWGGGGTFAAVGTMYLHQCVTSGSDTGVSCSTANAYNDTLTLQGGSGSTSYVVGDIITDQLGMGGNPSIFLDLNKEAAFYLLKATLVR